MKRFTYTFRAMAALLLLASAIPFTIINALDGTAVATEPTLVISEVQTGGAGSGTATQEFIEIYNPGATAVDVTGWRLQYKANNPTSAWSNKGTLAGQVEPRGFYLTATSAYAVAHPELETQIKVTLNTTSLAADNGHVRLLVPGVTPEPDVEIDKVGWGGAIDAEGGHPTSAPPGGQSVRRLFNNEGKIIDTNDNLADFVLAAVPTPETTPPVGVPDPDPEPDPDPDPDPEPEPTEHLDIEITELLVDPVEPQNDSNDEFAELHNDNSEPVNLSGYVLKTGGNLQYQQTLGDVTLAAGQYLAFRSSSNSITLANSGGAAQLLKPDSSAASELVEYPAAEPGQSWSLIGSLWQWTNNVTPDAANKVSSGLGGSEDPADTGSGNGVSTNTVYPILEITELFVDPATPLKDVDDEFVEIYNPNAKTIKLTGYALFTGSTGRTKYNLPDGQIKPGQYLAFFNRSANISLANQGGGARLEDANGKLIDKTKSYGESASGDAWAKFPKSWQWTGTPTPNKANVQSTAHNTNSNSSNVAGAFNNSSAQSGDGNNNAVASLAAPVSNSLVATLGGVALLYGLYEFRYDLRNRFQIFKRFFGMRGAGGS